MLKNHRRQHGLARYVEPILTLEQFAALNSISAQTLYRTIKRGEGPKVVRLSPRRLGIRESDGAKWQAARIQDRA